MVAYLGSFGAGFMNAFLQAQRLKMEQEFYRTRELYFQWIMNGSRPGYFGRGGEFTTGWRGAPQLAPWSLGEGGTGAALAGGDPAVRDHIIQWSIDHGKDPNEALAMWRQESGYGTNMHGDKGPDGTPSSFGDFQFHFGGMNPNMPHPGMGDDFLNATGIDVRQPLTEEQRFKAIDYALDRMNNKGFGDWETSRKVLGLGHNWSDASPQEISDWKEHLKTAPAETKKEEAKAPEEAKPADKAEPAKADGTPKTATPTTAPPAPLSSAGGTYIKTKDGDWYKTNEEGNVVGGKVDPKDVPDAVKKQVGGEQTTQAEPFKPYQVAGPWEPPPGSYQVAEAMTPQRTQELKDIYQQTHQPPPEPTTPAITTTEGRPDVGIPPPPITTTEGRLDTAGPPAQPTTPAITTTEGRPDTAPVSGIPIGGGPGMTMDPKGYTNLTAGSEAKGKEADKPAKKAETVSAEKKAPTKAIPEPSDVMRGMPVGGRGGGAQQITALPRARDPFWRPNPPLDSKSRAVVDTKTPPPKTPQPATGIPQWQHNIQQAAQNVKAAVTGQPAATTAPTTTPPAAASAAPATDAQKNAAEMMAMEPMPNFGGDEGGGGQGGPSVQVPDVPFVPTDAVTRDPFAGQNTTGIPYQPGQVAQAQPVPAPYQRRQEDAGDEGDESPAAALAARKGGPIWKFQAAGVVPPVTPSTINPYSYIGQGTDPSGPSAGYTGELGYEMSLNPGQNLGNITSGQVSQDVANMTPAQTQYMDQEQALRSQASQYAAGNYGTMGGAGGNPLANMQMNQAYLYAANALPLPGTPTPAAAPAAPTVAPTVQNTITNPAITAATTQVNPASGSSTTQNTATGTPLTWATGQTGTITPPNTSPGVATFGGSGSSDVPNYYNPTTTQNPSGATYGATSADDIYTNQAGYRRGGAIPERPTLKFQTGGVAYSTNPVEAAIESGTYKGPTMGGGWMGSTPLSALDPNQQAWAAQQSNIWNEIQQGGAQDAAYWGSGGTNPTGPVNTMQYLNQLTMMPAGISPAISEPPPTSQNTLNNSTIAPATTQVNPASSTSVSNPAAQNTATGSPLTWATGQSGTITPPDTSAGVSSFGAGSSGAPNYYNPYTSGNNMQNPAGTTYQRGGAVAFDDGGDVNAAFLGAPPGMPMGGQGQQPIPPIYYNPATFSPYGAGVGKGVTASSYPTIIAQGAPTYRRGGPVMRFQAGGEVIPPSQWQSTGTPTDYMQQAEQASGVNQQGGLNVGQLIQAEQSQSYQTPQMQMPKAQQMPSGGGPGSGFSLGSLGNLQGTGGSGMLGQWAGTDPTSAMFNNLPSDAFDPGSSGFRRGGTVMRYQDAGPVGADESVGDPSIEQADYNTSMDTSMISPAAAYGPPRASVPSMGGMMRMGGMRMGGMGGMGTRMPMPRAMGGGNEYLDPQGNPLYDEQGYLMHPVGSNGVSPYPQITDGQGNPSYGFISALGSVFHFLGNALGLGPQSGAMPTDPMVQTNRRDFANGVQNAPPETAEAAINSVDPTRQLNRELRVIGGFENVYKQSMANGDTEGAVRAGSSLLGYLQTVSSEYGKNAVISIRQGDLQAGIKALTGASENTPNGQHFEGHVDPDTGKINAKRTDLSGKVIWQGTITPQSLLQIAGKVADGSYFYSSIENTLAQYDPRYAAMVRQKQASEAGERQSQAILAGYNRRYGGQGGAIPTQPGQPMPGGGSPPQLTPAAATGAGGLTAGSQAPQAIPATATGAPMPATGAPNARTGAPTPGPAPAAPSPDATGSAQAVTRPESGLERRAGITPAEYTATQQANAPPPSTQTAPISRTAIETQIKSNYINSQTGGFYPTADMPNPKDYDISDPDPATHRSEVNRFAKDMGAWENDRYKQMQDDIASGYRDASEAASQSARLQTEQWQATTKMAAEKASELRQARQQQYGREQQARSQAHAEFMDKIKRQATISDKLQDPRTDTELNDIMRIDPTTGTQGVTQGFNSVPEEYLATSPTVAVGADGKKLSSQAAQQQYTTNYTEAERAAMDQLWTSGVKWNKNVAPATVADVVTGVVNGTYRDPQFSIVPFKDSDGSISPDDPYMAGSGSTRRVAMTVYRPSSRTSTTIILPDQDAKNILNTHLRYFDRQPPEKAPDVPEPLVPGIPMHGQAPPIDMSQRFRAPPSQTYQPIPGRPPQLRQGIPTQ